jgi:hypothetical protein
VRSLADELAARNTEVFEAATFEDDIAMVVSDGSIHGIFVDWAFGAIQSLTKKAWSFSRPSARANILVLLSVPLYAIVCKRISIHGTRTWAFTMRSEKEKLNLPPLKRGD